MVNAAIKQHNVTREDSVYIQESVKCSAPPSRVSRSKSMSESALEVAAIYQVCDNHSDVNNLQIG